MPIYESVCPNVNCPGYAQVHERFEHHATDSDPDCPACGTPQQRVISTFGVVFTGDLSAGKYNDKTLENAHLSGHWAYPRRPAPASPRRSSSTPSTSNASSAARRD